MQGKTKTLRDIDVANKRVLVCVDFNVPLDVQQQITDDTRIKATLPMIRYLLERGAMVILMSHLGHPKGQVVETLRLAPVAHRLSELLGRPVHMAADCIGTAIEEMSYTLRPGQIVLLENLRFHPEEEQNELGFACQLAALGDLYVNNAFRAAHRARASTEGITHCLPTVIGTADGERTRETQTTFRHDPRRAHNF